MSITDELREYASHCAGGMGGDALTAIADRIDKAIASEYVRLPKDADGVPIHIGDVMDTEHFGTVEVEGFVHRSVAFYNYSEQPAYLCTTPVDLCHHHHEPTVEDVLRDVVTLCHNTWKEGSITGFYDVDDVMDSGNIAELTKRIREVVEHERD